MSPTKEGQSHHTKGPGKVTELLQPTRTPAGGRSEQSPLAGISQGLTSPGFQSMGPGTAGAPWGSCHCRAGGAAPGTACRAAVAGSTAPSWPAPETCRDGHTRGSELAPGSLLPGPSCDSCTPLKKAEGARTRDSQGTSLGHSAPGQLAQAGWSLATGRNEALIWSHRHPWSALPGGREVAVELTVSAEGGDCQETTETRKEQFSSSRLVSMEIKLTLTRGLQLCWQTKAELRVTPAVTSLKKAVCFSHRSLR